MNVLNTKVKKNKHFKDPVLPVPKEPIMPVKTEKLDFDDLFDSELNTILISNNASMSMDKSTCSINDSELVNKLNDFKNNSTPVYKDENIIQKITSNIDEIAINIENSYENSLCFLNKFIESIRDYHTLHHYSNKDNKESTLKPSKELKFKIEEFYVRFNIQYYIEHLLTLPNYLLSFKKLSIVDGIKKLIKEVKNIMTNNKLTYLYKQIDYLIDGLFYDLKYLLEMILFIIELSVIY